MRDEPAWTARSLHAWITIVAYFVYKSGTTATFPGLAETDFQSLSPLHIQ